MTCPDDTAVKPDVPEDEGADFDFSISRPLTPLTGYSSLEVAGLNRESDHQRLSVGNVHLGAAAFAGLVVTTIAAYLSWLAHVQVPPEVLVPTGTIVGTAVGYIFPSD